MPNNWKRSLYKIVFVIVIAMCLHTLYGTVLTTWRLYKPFRTGMDDTTIWAQRIEKVQEGLPPNNKTIGYLTESDIPGIEFNPIDHDEEYVMTQYFLAPRIIAQGAGYDFVMGNFADPRITPADFEMLYGLKLIAQFSGGIYLFEREQP